MITRRQKTVLDYIRGYMAERGGVAPSYEEIGQACGMRAKSHVCRVIQQLEERGKIVRLPHRARAIRVLDEVPIPPPLRIVPPGSPTKPRVDYTNANAFFWRWDDFNKRWEKWLPKR